MGYASYNGNLSNWQTAFLAFAGGSDPVAAANYVNTNKGSDSASSAYKTISNQGLTTNEANATALWMCSPATSKLLKSSFTFSDVTNALNAASGASAPISTPAVVQPVVPAQTAVVVQPAVVTTAPVTPAVVVAPQPSATDSAAVTLKAQIEAAKLVYNQYAPGTYTVTA